MLARILLCVAAAASPLYFAGCGNSPAGGDPSGEGKTRRKLGESEGIPQPAAENDRTPRGTRPAGSQPKTTTSKPASTDDPSDGPILKKPDNAPDR